MRPTTPEIVETTVCRADELDQPAQEKARDWFRGIGFDHDWYAFVYSDFERICSILGIELRAVPVRSFGGANGSKPGIWFSGFWSQGDGACFEGSYAYAKGAAHTIRTYAPLDVELHDIADALQAVQRRNLYQLCADIRHRGRYYHEPAMAIGVERDSPTGQDMTGDAEEIVADVLRDLARWLYRRLEEEYGHQTSDAEIDAALEAGAFTFTQDGLRFG